MMQYEQFTHPVVHLDTQGYVHHNIISGSVHYTRFNQNHISKLTY